MHAMWYHTTAKPVLSRHKAAALAVWLSLAQQAVALQYREDFNQPGRPATLHGIQWDYKAELSPVSAWSDLIPGDGFAYLSVERDMMKRTRFPFGHWPFQKLIFGPVTRNHRISMRARNTAIPGVAAMIFTYREDEQIDEIDIEIAAQDTESRRRAHDTFPEDGWTDARFVTWIGADRHKPEPSTMIKQPIRDDAGQSVSHRDGRFHVYSIEWRNNDVQFFIDGVHQETIPDAVPDKPTAVMFGLRQMPWAGRPDWVGYQTMLVDWVAVEPLE